eukprot:Pgem_evm2s3149
MTYLINDKIFINDIVNGLNNQELANKHEIGIGLVIKTKKRLNLAWKPIPIKVDQKLMILAAFYDDNGHLKRKPQQPRVQKVADDINMIKSTLYYFLKKLKKLTPEEILKLRDELRISNQESQSSHNFSKKRIKHGNQHNK